MAPTSLHLQSSPALACPQMRVNQMPTPQAGAPPPLPKVPLLAVPTLGPGAGDHL